MYEPVLDITASSLISFRTSFAPGLRNGFEEQLAQIFGTPKRVGHCYIAQLRKHDLLSVVKVPYRGHVLVVALKQHRRLTKNMGRLQGMIVLGIVTAEVSQSTLTMTRMSRIHNRTWYS